jgi:hypothetical protein
MKPVVDDLIVRGFVSTRACSLARALDQLHHSVCHMDPEQLQVLKREFPEVLKMCQYFGGQIPLLNKLDI